MLKGVDHIVVVVPELETAIKNYGQLGFSVVPGGKHVALGSHNALVAFADGAYMELIAFFQPNPDHRWWQVLQKGGGLIDFCMQTDDLQADMAAFRQTGINMSDLMPMSRVRPDGYKIDWVLSIPMDERQGVIPFLIEDKTPRQERIPRETNHPNQVTGIGTLTIAVSDVDAVKQKYSQALGKTGQSVDRDDLSATGVRFTIGPHDFDIVAPKGPDSPLNEFIQKRGAGLYAAALKTAADKKGSLDAAAALGARFSLV